MHRTIGTFIIAFCLLHDNGPAEAAQNKRRKASPTPAPRVEIYPSIEFTTALGQSKDFEPNPSPLEPSEESNSTPQLQDDSLQRPKKLSAIEPSNVQIKNFQYEAVPSDQRERIAERLKWVERIILETGKAYDYRMMTVSQLKKVLEQSTQTSPTQDRGSRPDRSAEVPLPPQAL